MSSDTVIQVAVSLHCSMKHVNMDGESVEKSLSTFHVRFQQEKMKVVKADTEDGKRIQDFQETSASTRPTGGRHVFNGLR